MSPVGALLKGLEKAKAAKRAVAPEAYDRFERKDFWNDPERWDGIEDPWATKIWEVRRRDVIDVRPKAASDDDLRNTMAAQQAAWAMQNAALAGQYNYHPLQGYQSSLLNQCAQQPGYYDPFGFRFGRY